jgi:hypothetical protein
MSDLRSLLKQKNERNRKKQVSRLLGNHKVPHPVKGKSQSPWHIVYEFGRGHSWGYSSGLSIRTHVPIFTQSDMDAVNDKLKDVESKLEASIDEIAGLKQRLEDAEKRATFAESELEEFKTVSAFFLADFITDIDNIMPDDLEYGLDQYEEAFEKTLIQYAKRFGIPEDTNKGWVLILQLCRKLGMAYTTGYTDTQNIKVFIKELARANTLLEKENVKYSTQVQEIEQAMEDTVNNLLNIHERRRR